MAETPSELTLGVDVEVGVGVGEDTDAGLEPSSSRECSVSDAVHPGNSAKKPAAQFFWTAG